MSSLMDRLIPTASTKHLMHLIHLAFGILILHIAFNALQSLASSIFPDKLGFWLLGTQAAAFSVAAILIAPFVLLHLSPKWALVISSACYVVLMFTTLHPTYPIVITGATIMGLGAGVLWTAQGAYLTYGANNYALSRNESRESSVGLFNGVFFVIFQSNLAIGGLLSYFLLDDSPTPTPSPSPTPTPSSIIPSPSSTIITSSSSFNPAPTSNFTFLPNELTLGANDTITRLLWTFIGLAIGSVLVFAALPQEQIPESEESNEVKKKRGDVLGSVFSAVALLVSDVRMILLVPAMFYSGLEQGLRNIPLVFLAYGLVNAPSAYILGKISDKFGPIPVVVIGWISHATFFAFYLLNSYGTFIPTNFLGDNPWIIYLTACIFALGDASWQLFAPIMMSSLYPSQASGAYANMKFFQSAGNAIAVFVGGYIILEWKLAAGAAFLCLGGICVFILRMLGGFVLKVEPEQLRTQYDPLDA